MVSSYESTAIGMVSMPCAEWLAFMTSRASGIPMRSTWPLNNRLAPDDDVNTANLMLDDPPLTVKTLRGT